MDCSTLDARNTLHLVCRLSPNPVVARVRSEERVVGPRDASLRRRLLACHFPRCPAPAAMTATLSIRGVLLLATAATVAATAFPNDGQPAEQPQQLLHLRSLRDLPFPRTLGAAAALHAEAMRRARAVERHHGHRRVAPRTAPPPPRQGSLYGGSAGVASPTPSLIVPADYGADPTGANDSTAAMQAAVHALLAARGPRHTMASNITDLGGATMDLSGGTYLVSAPLVIPPMYGNAQIVRGTLRASPKFPADRFLVEIGSSLCDPRLANGKPDIQGSCGQFINVNEVMFDAAHVAAGGVSVTKTMGTTLGPSVFFTGFTVAGVQINGGHECMVQQASCSLGGPQPLLPSPASLCADKILPCATGCVVRAAACPPLQTHPRCARRHEPAGLVCRVRVVRRAGLGVPGRPGPPWRQRVHLCGRADPGQRPLSHRRDRL